MHAIADAAKHFTPGFAGAKTIIVLTDGGDDLFYTADGDELRIPAMQ